LVNNNDENSGAVISHYQCSSSINNSIIWGYPNSGAAVAGGITFVRSSIVEGGYPGEGVLVSDPLFTNLTDDFESSDLTLLPCSPAIDAANDSLGAATDYLGAARVDDKGVPNCQAPDAGDDNCDWTADIGAFEYAGPSSSECQEPPDPYPPCEGSDVWLDEETGLCWQVSSIADVASLPHRRCFDTFGGDWRVPTIQELISLIDGCDQSTCTLVDPHSLTSATGCAECPAGQGQATGCYFNPNLNHGDVVGECTDAGSAVYLSFSNYAEDYATRWSVDFATGGLSIEPRTTGLWLRCVRGPFLN
jgi:hypothetical protein